MRRWLGVTRRSTSPTGIKGKIEQSTRAMTKLLSFPISRASPNITYTSGTPVPIWTSRLSFLLAPRTMALRTTIFQGSRLDRIQRTLWCCNQVKFYSLRHRYKTGQLLLSRLTLFLKYAALHSSNLQAPTSSLLMTLNVRTSGPSRPTS